MTREVVKTYRVILVSNNEDSALDVRGSSIDVENGNLFVSNDRGIVATFAEGVWKHVREVSA